VERGCPRYPSQAPSPPGWAHGPGTGLSAGGLLAASCQTQWGGEGRVYCSDTPSKLEFEFLVLNNLDIHCVSGYFT